MVEFKRHVAFPAVQSSEAPVARSWNPALYDSKHAFVWRLGAGVLEMLDPKPGERVLDLGCGTGHLTAQVDAAGARVVGIDSSPSMIAEAKRNFPGLAFEVMDARDFRFDAPFDAIFSNAALHWIKEQDRVAESVSKALRPGGRFVAEFGGKGNVQKLIAGLNAALGAVAGRERDNPWCFPGIAEYSALLEQCGLEVVNAALIDRPTTLDDGENGLAAWIRMFAGAYLSELPEGNEEEFVQEAERRLRPALFRGGSWVVDYRRLRIAAAKRADI